MARHSRTRVSRPLLAVLGVTMAIGGGAYLHNVHKSRAAQADRDRLSLKAVDPDVLDVKPAAHPASAPLPTPTTNALLTETPGNTPANTPANNAAPLAPVLAAAPLSSALAAAPTTRPAEIAHAPTTRPADTALRPAPRPEPAHVAAAATTAAPTPVLASATIAPHAPEDAKAKLEAGDLVGARQLLNEPLIAGRLSAAEADAARHQLSDLNATLIFSRKRFKDDPFITPYQVLSGDRLARIADKHNVTWELLCRINGLADARKVRAGQWIKIPNGPFHCIITKSAFRLDVYLGSPGEAGSLFVTSFPVGLGKDNSTPTGAWVLQPGSKAHPATYYSPRGEGVIAADDPKNPLGGYWMGLAGVSGNALDKNSYGIHGTIEPDSIGKQASLGCIRLGHEDISLLYDLLVDGKSKVVVKD